ncbi:uncharacterized protein LOC108346330 [Vigna angularis]|nr:uncharacterized protein LOC108346330 [Vigna angularis]XP_052735925.1 uncharacterized protein LOC108346330 [Vigna angularis]
MQETSILSQSFVSFSHQHSNRLADIVDMGSVSGSGKVHHWNVFDGVKIIAATPEALMAEIDSAISAMEHSRATAMLDEDEGYDARVADEAYKAGCAALAAGKLDEALRSLNLSLAKCPPDKASALAKLNSLIALASNHLQASSK